MGGDRLSSARRGPTWIPVDRPAHPLRAACLFRDRRATHANRASAASQSRRGAPPAEAKEHPPPEPPGEGAVPELAPLEADCPAPDTILPDVEAPATADPVVTSGALRAAHARALATPLVVVPLEILTMLRRCKLPFRLRAANARNAQRCPSSGPTHPPRRRGHGYSHRSGPSPLIFRALCLPAAILGRGRSEFVS
jgi:hypothetical protein